VSADTRELTRSCGNVFVDLGLLRSDELLAKAALAMEALTQLKETGCLVGVGTHDRCFAKCSTPVLRCAAAPAPAPRGSSFRNVCRHRPPDARRLSGVTLRPSAWGVA